MSDDRARPTRMTERFTEADQHAIAALVRSAPVAHVAFVEGDQPRVMPVAVAADGASLLLHGSTGSRWLRLLAHGIRVSAAITALDGLVVARSAFESSMQYRSAVLFGRCEALPEEQKTAALDLLTDALIPGRVAELRRPTARELAATLVLRMRVEQCTLKIADAGPEDPAEDVAGTAWAGVLPVRSRYPVAIPAADLRPDIELPPSVRALIDGD